MTSRVRLILVPSLAAALLLLPSCTGAKPAAATFPMGEKVKVGKLFYQVLEAQWLPELRGAKHPPKDRILQLHMTVTNAGGAEMSVPLLRLIDSSGREIVEESEIEGNPTWMGLLRRLQPAITEEGTIYFDVPVGAYKLELVDTSDAEDEKVAYVEIPASLAPPPAIPGKGGQ